jgi:hypothetical protein
MPTIASRLFVDLVYRGTAKWANWEPAIKIEVWAFTRLPQL